MLIYICTIVYLLGLNIIFKTLDEIKKNRKLMYSKTYMILSGIPLVLIGALRWNVGTDYWQYARNYNNYVINVWNDFISYSDPGIKMIAWLGSLIFDDYSSMFFLASFITITLYLTTIRKYSNAVLFSILLYILVGSWLGSFNGVKQYLAAAIIFAGHRYIFNKMFIKYFLVIVTASFFHISAWIMLLLYWVPLKKLKFKQIFIIILISSLTLFSYEQIFQLIENIRKDSFDMNEYVNRQVNYLRILVYISPLLYYLFFTVKSKLNNQAHFYINLLFVNAILAIITSQSAYLARFVIYTQSFLILGLPLLINHENKYINFLSKFVIVTLFLLFWWVDTTKSSSLINYNWIFER